MRLLTSLLAFLLLLAAPALGQISNPAPGGASEVHLGAVSGEAAVPTATLTKSTKTTAYGSGQIIGQNAIAGSNTAIVVVLARANDRTGMALRARLKVNDASWLNATVRVHLLKDAPTFTNGDAGNFAAGISESNHICAFDVLLELSFTGPVVKGYGVPTYGNQCVFEPAAGTRNVSAVLETRSITIGGHTSQSTFTLAVEALQN